MEWKIISVVALILNLLLYLSLSVQEDYTEQEFVKMNAKIDSLEVEMSKPQKMDTLQVNINLKTTKHGN
jgi:septum formation topological specificity factor MinE